MKIFTQRENLIMSSQERNPRIIKKHFPVVRIVSVRISIPKEPSAMSETGTKENLTNSDETAYNRQLTYAECFEIVHNGGRLLSKEYESMNF